ncbi:hypothetical protein GWI33_013892, partial [Rhynchophorus ferrugineus]
EKSTYTHVTGRIPPSKAGTPLCRRFFARTGPTVAVRSNPVAVAATGYAAGLSVHWSGRRQRSNSVAEHRMRWRRLVAHPAAIKKVHLAYACVQHKRQLLH